MTRGEFARRLLRRLDAPATHHNLVALVTWMQAEGSDAAFNPLATTRRMPGSSDFNSAGVQNYASAHDGVEATAATLHEVGHGYRRIVVALRSSAPAKATIDAVGDSEWGTDGDLLRRVLPEVRGELERYESALIAT